MSARFKVSERLAMPLRDLQEPNRGWVKKLDPKTGI